MTKNELLQAAKYWNEKALATHSNSKTRRISKIYVARYRWYLSLYNAL